MGNRLPRVDPAACANKQARQTAMDHSKRGNTLFHEIVFSLNYIGYSVS